MLWCWRLSATLWGLGNVCKAKPLGKYIMILMQNMSFEPYAEIWHVPKKSVGVLLAAFFRFSLIINFTDLEKCCYVHW